ncbi:dolichyl-phosphate beta-glucosyltransferase [Nanoarchaeota archaeon]
MAKMKVEVNLPILNEESILAKSVGTLRKFLRKNMPEYDCRIVIVDNGSDDRTNEICKQLKKKYSDVDFIRIEKRGRGRALKTAWKKSKADICSYMDIDLSTGLKAYPKMIDALAKKGYDIATGSRFMKGSRVKRGFKREVLSRGYVTLLKIILGIRFNDAQCGFKAVNRKVIKNIMPRCKDNNWFFDTELMTLCQYKGYRIKEIPVKWTEDTDSRVKIFKTVKEYLRDSAKLRIRILRNKI